MSQQKNKFKCLPENKKIKTQKNIINNSENSQFKPKKNEEEVKIEQKKVEINNSSKHDFKVTTSYCGRVHTRNKLTVVSVRAGCGLLWK